MKGKKRTVFVSRKTEQVHVAKIMAHQYNEWEIYSKRKILWIVEALSIGVSQILFDNQQLLVID